MAIISLDRFFEDTIVLHFGGKAGSINAYTFAEALIGFADTAYAVSSTIDPGQEIEIILEATGPGSFRAVIRRLKKVTPVAGAIFWGVVTNTIYDATLKKDDPVLITINTSDVIIKKTHGHDIVIVPRNVYDASENAKKNPAVKKGIKKTFETMKKDPDITEFGLTSSIHDAQPLVTIPRADFSVVTQQLETEDPPLERTKSETARLVILNAWLNRAKRNWSFEWNGEPISAPISDTEFLDQLDRREFLLGTGDALDVEITYKQTFDPAIRVYVNDPNSFVITRVIKPVPRA
jgi:hypothetical protein